MIGRGLAIAAMIPLAAIAEEQYNADIRDCMAAPYANDTYTACYNAAKDGLRRRQEEHYNSPGERAKRAAAEAEAQRAAAKDAARAKAAAASAAALRARLAASAPDRAKLASEYDHLLRMAFPHLNYIKVRVLRQGAGYALMGEHDLFTRYTFSAGPGGRAVDAWISQHYQRLRLADINRVGVQGTGNYSSSGWFDLK